MIKNFKVIYELFFQNKYYAIFVILLSTFAIFIEGMSYASILPLLENYLGTGGTTNLSRIMEKSLFIIGFETNILSLSILFVILIFLKNILKVSKEYFTSNFKYILRETWIQNIYYSFNKTDFEYIASKNRGKIYNNIYHETTNSGQAIDNLIEIFTSSISIIFFTLLLFLTSMQFSIIIFFTSLVIFLLNKIILQNYSKRIGNKEVELNQLISSSINDSLVSFKNIRIFNVMNEFTIYMRKHLENLRKIIVQWRVLTFATMPIIESLLVLVLIIFIIYWKNINEDLSVLIPILALIVVVGQRLMQQLSRLLVSINSFNRLKKSFSVIHESMNYHLNNKSNKFMNDYSSNLILDKLEEDIFIDNLTFNYNKTNNVFNNFNLRIKKGKITIIKGESGSGKSTLLELLLGILIPDEGEIRVNGNNLLKYSNLYNKFLYVSQKNILFTDSIKSNVLFFLKNYNNDKFKDICKKLNIDDFVNDLPKGYDSIIENSGENLSGGQVQRLCIARALIRSPELLVLDEITSSLDKKNEKNIFDSIFHIMKGKTVIISIHKDSLDYMADEIVYIKNGKISKIITK